LRARDQTASEAAQTKVDPSHLSSVGRAPFDLFHWTGRGAEACRAADASMELGPREVCGSYCAASGRTIRRLAEGRMRKGP